MHNWRLGDQRWKNTSELFRSVILRVKEIKSVKRLLCVQVLCPILGVIFNCDFFGLS
jgi:hypothetical protein